MNAVRRIVLMFFVIIGFASINKSAYADGGGEIVTVDPTTGLLPGWEIVPDPKEYECEDAVLIVQFVTDGSEAMSVDRGPRYRRIQCDRVDFGGVEGVVFVVSATCGMTNVIISSSHVDLSARETVVNLPCFAPSKKVSVTEPLVPWHEVVRLCIGDNGVYVVQITLDHDPPEGYDKRIALRLPDFCIPPDQAGIFI